MRRPRKIFRIEQMGIASRPDSYPEIADVAPPHLAIMHQLLELRGLIEQALTAAQRRFDGEDAPASEAPQLKRELGLIHDAITRTKRELATIHANGVKAGTMCRATSELGAVAGSSERATQQILAAAEDIDQIANTLSAAVKGEYRDLAQDIQDRVIQIFEACNFQDVTGQRIAKVTAAVKSIEEHVMRMMEIWGGIEAFKEFDPAAGAACNGAARLVNGPKLDGEPGHATQPEIDEIFAAVGT